MKTTLLLLVGVLLAGAVACDEGAAALVAPYDATVIEAEIPAVLTALREGRPQDALEALLRLEAAGTLPDGALHYRAIAQMDLGQTEAARATWDEELAVHPGNGKAWVFRAEVLIEAGDLDEATRSLETARPLLEDFPAWSLIAGRLARLQARDADALRHFSDFLSFDPYGAEAAECHQGIAQAHASRSEPDSAARAAFHAARADELENVHRYRAAFLTRLIAQPEDLESLLGLANTDLSLYFEYSPRIGIAGDPRLLAGAEVPLTRLLQLQPDHAAALANMGSIRAEQRRFDDAAAYFVRATEVDPTAALPWLHLGRLKLRAGLPGEAIAAFEVGLASAGEGEQRGRLLAELGQALLGTDPAQALAHLDEYLLLFPEDPAGLRGETEALRERLSEASGTDSEG